MEIDQNTQIRADGQRHPFGEGPEDAPPKPVPATQEAIDDAVATLRAELTDMAPETLNSFLEVAAALNNDEDFAANVTAVLATKQDAATAATDTELADTVATINAALAAKPDAADLTVLPSRTTAVNTNVLATDAGGVIEATDAITVTIQTNATEAVPTSSVVEVVAMGAGVPVTIDAVAGVTLNGVDGGSTTIDAQYASASLRKTDTNAWVVIVGGAATVA